MSETTYDWTRFRRKVFINAPAEEVFQVWLTANGITRFFIAAATYTTPEGRVRQPDEQIQAGDQYHWRWHQDYEETGRILQVGPGLSLQFTFGAAYDAGDNPIVVTVRCHEEDGQTRLELEQANMADLPAVHSGWHMGCNLGWSFFLTNLKALLEHGIDLRETDPERAYLSRALTT